MTFLKAFHFHILHDAICDIDNLPLSLGGLVVGIKINFERVFFLEQNVAYYKTRFDFGLIRHFSQ